MIVDFFKTAANLKRVPRQGWIDKAGISNPESVADHTFSASMMAMIFGDMLNLDTQKLLKMSLLHDLAESVTGDITPGRMNKDAKLSLEQDAMTKILSELPDALRQSYHHVWCEFVENRSAESRLMHELDKLEMALQASVYSKTFDTKRFEEFFNTSKQYVKTPELKRTLDSLVPD